MAGAPPPYGPKKSSTTTIIFIVLGVCAVCCILGVLGVAGAGYFGFKRTQNMIACAIGFEEAGKALSAYADDHGGKLPKADKWQDEIRPYFVKQMQKDEDQGVKMFGSFDPAGDWVCKDESGSGPSTGIAFNSDLSGLKVDDIKNKGTTMILFEVPKTGSNLSQPYVELSDSTSPKIFGKPRGWIKIDGRFKVQGMDNNSNVKFND